MGEFAFAEVFDAVATAVGERPCFVQGDDVRTFDQVRARTDGLGAWLVEQGVTFDGPVTGDLHEGVQPRVGILAHNVPGYLEAMLGCYKARAVPFNINFRYVAEELRYLFEDASPAALVVSSSLADRVEGLIDGPVLQIPDDSGADLLAGATWFDDAAATEGALPDPTPDDRYLLYTGGTTGMPKGVLWRQADAFVACSAGPDAESVGAIAEAAAGSDESRTLPAPPFMHGAAQWIAFNTLWRGATVVLAGNPRSFDAADVLDTCESKQVNLLLIVGDAFATPLIAEMRERPRDLSSLGIVLSGGLGLSPSLKEQLMELIPHALIVDNAGASETGSQMSSASTGGGVNATFQPGAGTVILSEDRTRQLAPEETERGWLATTGRIPMGYLGDPEKTAATFQVVDGTRYVIAGDRAMWEDGQVRLLGRDSVTINTGGEKVFAEEVETAVRTHPAVADVIVCGLEHERWGQQVVAVVALVEGAEVPPDELRRVAGEHIASYKLPKEIVFVDEVKRSPAGKGDYAWARETAGDRL